MASLRGRGAVVVGGGQSHPGNVGNGRAAALAFGREGARVVVADVDEASAEETAGMIREAGGDAIAVVSDVMIEGACARLAEVAIRRLGRIDILHNNVGGTRFGEEGDNDIFSLEEPTFDALINLNLKSMWLSSKHLAPPMRENGGAIINVSSVASVVPRKYDNLAAYRMAKAGVNALTMILASWGGPYGIRANALIVGSIDTGMAAARYAERGRTHQQQVAEGLCDVPLNRRLGSGWDVGNAAAFLASDAAAFISGILLPVDGGQTSRT